MVKLFLAGNPWRLRIQGREGELAVAAPVSIASSGFILTEALAQESESSRGEALGLGAEEWRG